MTAHNGLLLHPRTKKQTKLFLQNPAHSLLILGDSGSGKVDLGLAIARELLGFSLSAKLSDYPFFLHVKRQPASRDISIDDVRAITKFLRLKIPGSKPIRRVIMIGGAQYLSIEAQNALLKILEEPSGDTVFILTAPYEQSLLPTIVSRCQQVWVNPVTMAQAAEYYANHYAKDRVESAWRLSQGSSALLNALLSDDVDHPLKQAIAQAKTYLTQPAYNRLLQIEKIAKNKEDLRLFLEALGKVLTALHHAAVRKSSTIQATKLLSDRKLVQEASHMLEANANSRLIILNLHLNLKT